MSKPYREYTEQDIYELKKENKKLKKEKVEIIKALSTFNNKDCCNCGWINICNEAFEDCVDFHITYIEKVLGI